MLIRWGVRRSLLVLITILMSFSVLTSQVIIRERVEITAKAPKQVPTEAASGGSITVSFSWSGSFTQGKPKSMVVKNACGDNAFTDQPGTLSIPAKSGGTDAIVRWSGGPGVATLTFTAGGGILRSDMLVSTCDSCTYQMNPTVFLESGVKLTMPNLITHGESVSITMTKKSFTVCSVAFWHPNMFITLTITENADLGGFCNANDSLIGTTVTGTLAQLNGIHYCANGSQPPGDKATVTIEAQIEGQTIGTAFIEVQRTAPEPTLHITYPSQDTSITLTSTFLPSITLQEIHTPGVGEQFEPEISWSPSRTINTADYFAQIQDSINLNITATAQNDGGIVSDSRRITLKKEVFCTLVLPQQDTVATGDTIGLVFKKVKSNGTIEDFFSGQLFNVGIIGLGTLLAGDKSGGTLSAVPQPVWFVAPSTIEADTIEVSIIASAIDNIVASSNRLAFVQSGRVGSNNLASTQECEIRSIWVKKAKPRLVIIDVLPNDDPHDITKVPAMPPLVLNGLVQNSGWEGSVNYFWRMHIEWDDPSGVVWEKSVEAAHSVDSRVDVWQVVWDNFTGGDKIVVDLRATFNGKEFVAEPMSNRFQILGENPGKEDAIAGLSDFQRAVMYQESRYEQFKLIKDNAGLPKIHRNIRDNVEYGADYGIMQVNFANFFKLNYDQMLRMVWNWQGAG